MYLHRLFNDAWSEIGWTTNLSLIGILAAGRGFAKMINSYIELHHWYLNIKFMLQCFLNKSMKFIYFLYRDGHYSIINGDEVFLFYQNY